MSDYFDAAGNRISDGLTARAADVNTLRDEVGAGFDLLPSVEDITLGITNYAVDTGVANAYVVAPAAVTAYADGLLISFRTSNPNTGASTINVNGIGVKSIKRTSGEALGVGDILADIPVELRYSSATGFFYLNWRAAVTSYEFTGTVTFS
jgi:hypothetical protein